MNKKTLMLLATMLPLSALASESGLEMKHSVDQRIHCYQITNKTGQMLEEISLGHSWAGHPLKDNLSLTVTEHPAGWIVEKIKRRESGFQYFMLKSEARGSGDVGKFCFRMTRSVKGMESLPFSYLVKGEAYRRTGKAQTL